MTTFGSICSGIEAASVAFSPLGWQAAWFSEIDPWPSALLAHRYPAVPNLGDMLTLVDRIRSGEVSAPDVLCGGTPCQAFSVAGLRNSLDDARGNLSLTFCEIANEIDNARATIGLEPAKILWENVPGVLSTKDNAFGCFLAGLAGEDVPLVAPGGRWANAGYVLGPKRAIAWRVLDAQYFGVAQRRRRVFVVASAAEGFDPAAVLFEREGVRRNTAPSREARQEVAGSLTASAGRRCGVSDPDKGGIITMAHGHGGAEVAHERSPTLTCNHEAPIAAIPQTAQSVRGEGFDASEDGTGRGTPLVPVVFDTTQITNDTNRSNPKPGDPCHPLAAGTHPPTIAFDCKASGQNGFGVGPIASTLRAMGHAGSHQNGGGHQAVAYTTKLHNTGSNNAGKLFKERTTCLDANSPPPALLTAMQVRRLTPMECERLQGFPDRYTQIPWRGKDAWQCPDGPRYKALGNSWAVPVVEWIGRRMKEQMQ